MYGSDRKLRQWLEQREIPHVLAVKSNEKLWAWTEEGTPDLRLDLGGDSALAGTRPGVLAIGSPQHSPA